MKYVQSFNYIYDKDKKRYVLYYLAADLSLNIYNLYRADVLDYVPTTILEDIKELTRQGYTLNPDLSWY